MPASPKGRRPVVPLYVTTVLAATVATSLQAAEAPAAEASSSEVTEVVVTGTRTSNLMAVDSPSPIQILSPEVLKAASGNPDLMSTLAQIVPSLTMEAFGGDMAAQTLQARLRGLSPNHVLVLVNGKRRHTTANLAVLGGSPYQGGAGADLNFIPVEAIDHVEVLTDGAAAQYGSDAIAGVINIVLKKNSSGGEVQGSYGQYFNGGGVSSAYDGNIGLEPYEGAWFSLTGAYHNHGHTDVGADDPRSVTLIDSSNPFFSGKPIDQNIKDLPNYPHLNHIFGDAETHMKLAMLNAGLPIGENLQFYVFGSYGQKEAASYENYRNPSRISCTSASITGCATFGGVVITNADGTYTTYPYPYGFNPLEATHETDYQLTGGLKGMIGNFSWDLSSSYGSDKVLLYTLDSIGNSYPLDGKITPTDFYDGYLKATQWTTNLDVSQEIGPVNVALGLEYRRETYGIGAGIPDSYLSGGAQSYPGFSPASAGSHSRDNKSVYLDLAGKLLSNLRFDAAVRYEDYSDFGNTVAGKLSVKYDLTDTFGIRGTASNGFRAPTLAEEFYTSTNVGPSSAFVQLPPNSAAGQVIGLGKGLQAEKSVSFSAGMVWHPLPRVMATLDLYQITITNRITGTGSIYGQVESFQFDANGNELPAITTPYAAIVNDAINKSGSQLDPRVAVYGTTGITVFANGIDTRTRGADLTLKVPQDLPLGHIDWTVAATYAKTTITNTPPDLPALPGVGLYDQTALTDLTTANPTYVVNLGLSWTYEKLSVNLLEKIYGPASDYSSDGGDGNGTPEYFKNELGVTPITNLDIGYQFTKYLRLDIGSLNLFNRFPSKLNSTILERENRVGDYSSVSQYPTWSPYGINGGYYYAKVILTF